MIPIMISRANFCTKSEALPDSPPGLLAGAFLRYPHHIEGEQYLALNLLGIEQKMAGDCHRESC